MGTSRKARGFLALPGEIRNRVYNYYFESDYRCEIAAKGRCFNTAGSANHDSEFEPGARLDSPTVIRISRRLAKYNTVQGLRTNWLGSLHALNLVCSQVYMETVAFLYRKTLYIFDAPKRLDAFFSVVSAPRLEIIAKLQLHYDTYGPPRRTADLVWQDRHGQSWQRACKAASKKLTGLQELEFRVHVHDRAPKFSLREAWVMPMLQFRRLMHSKTMVDHDANTRCTAQHRSGLQIVKVQVQTWCLKNPLIVFNNNHRLAKASTHLHKLYGQAISLAIKGAKEEEAMASFNAAWEGQYAEWRHHLQFARTGW